jgi:hypothetical protein
MHAGNRSLVLVFGTAVILAACHKDPPLPTVGPKPQQVLQLTVKPVWNGAAFNKDSVYAAAGNQRIRVDQLKFYLSPVELTTAEDSTQPLFDVDLFDVTNGPVERTLHVPQGHYSGLKLGLGLPYALNHRDIATIPPNDPTGNNSGMYWNWASLYKFVIFTGKFDSDPNGTGVPPNTFDIHTGLDTCYRSRELPLLLDVDATDTARITIDVDIAHFFSDGNQVLDLSQGALWHGMEDINIALRVANLQIASFSAQAE